jgi:colanic acid biosynthesis glycosyl transferase WcaI
MHVMIVSPYYWPEAVGPGLSVHQLAADLVDRGHHVTVLTALPNYPAGKIFDGYRGRIFMRERVDGIDVIRAYMYATPRKSFWPRAVSFGTVSLSLPIGAALLSRPDVIYCISQPLPMGWIIELLSKFRRTPVVMNIRDIYPKAAISVGFLKNRVAIRMFEKMELSIYKQAAAIVVITETFRRDLLAKGVEPGKIHVIPNWADVDRVQPEPKSNAFRRSLAVDGNLLVMYAGGMGHNTCLETVIEAARLLAHESPQFVLIGDGHHKRALQEKAARYSLTNLRFLPFAGAEDYPHALAAADVQLVSLNQASMDTSLPGKTLQIMASGRPVLALAPAESDLSHLVNTAKCGVTVDPTDAQALARAIRGLAQSKEHLETMGQNARQFCLDHFERRHCTTQIEALLARTAGGLVAGQSEPTCPRDGC